MAPKPKDSTESPLSQTLAKYSHCLSCSKLKLAFLVDTASLVSWGTGFIFPHTFGNIRSSVVVGVPSHCSFQILFPLPSLNFPRFELHVDSPLIFLVIIYYSPLTQCFLLYTLFPAKSFLFPTQLLFWFLVFIF